MGRSERSGRAMARMRTAHLWLQVWGAVGAWVVGSMPPRTTIAFFCVFFFCFFVFFVKWIAYGFRKRNGGNRKERKVRPSRSEE